MIASLAPETTGSPSRNECLCAGGGHCPRFGRLVTAREQELCAGLAGTTAMQRTFLAAAEGRLPPVRLTVPPEPWLRWIVRLFVRRVSPPYVQAKDRLKTCVYRGRSMKGPDGKTSKRLTRH